MNDAPFLAGHSTENGQVKYYGVRDGLFRYRDADNVYVLGYIAHVIESTE